VTLLRAALPLSLLAFCLALCLALPLLGCARLAHYETPAGIPHWQDPAPPRLSPEAKADAYQADLEARFRMPDGVLRYRFAVDQPRDDYGDLPDGPFFAGLYLASQVLRFAATQEPAALREIEATLAGLELLQGVTGVPGLLARWVSRGVPARTRAPWHASAARPGYAWRGDVSKDQLAGYACGLGVALALAPEPALRERAARLALPLAKRLHEGDLRILDAGGERTTHGDLRPYVVGFPIGVNALIALAIAEAAKSAGDTSLADALAARGAWRAARFANLRPPGNAKRVNENMAYVSLLSLLLLTKQPAQQDALREIEARLWAGVRGEHNAFFAGVHVLASDETAARVERLAALAEFPDRKRRLPVDLTRPGFDFEQRALRSSKGLPRAELPVPLYLRPAGSNLWVSDPYALVGSLRGGEIEYSGVDYLLAYWLARARDRAVAGATAQGAQRSQAVEDACRARSGFMRCALVSRACRNPSRAARRSAGSPSSTSRAASSPGS
jgi:hypothetical protein